MTATASAPGGNSTGNNRLPSCRPAVLHQDNLYPGNPGMGSVNAATHAPPHVLGVMNLRGSVIPVVDLAAKLGLRSSIDSSRAAIIVAEVGGNIVGLVGDQVSDILSIDADRIQPVPDLGTAFHPAFTHGIIPLDRGIVCFLDLEHMFAGLENQSEAA